MSRIIYEGREFNLEFQEYHPPLWLSFWNSESFLKKYVELSGEDVGFIYIVKNGELTGFMEAAGSERLHLSLKSKLSRSWIDDQMDIFSNNLDAVKALVNKEEGKKQTKKSLIKFFSSLTDLLGKLNPHSNVSYMLSKITEEEILAKLTKLGQGSNASNILASNSQPAKETFLVSYKRRLEEAGANLKEMGYKFNTADEIRQAYSEKVDVRKQIDGLVKDYFCLGSLNSGKRDASFFIPELFTTMQETKVKPINIPVPKEISNDIYILQNMIYFKDECSTFLPPFVRYAPEKIWKSTAEFLNIFKEDLDYLLVEEIINLLGSKKDIAGLIARRKALTLFVHHPHRSTSVTEGALAEKGASEIMKQLKSDVTSNINEIIGKVGAKGKASGKVRIVASSGDISGFKEGEVLVTVYTGPEFVPSMKKAVAIVTDTGGITCHAAIVSRELNKPCVVGTKIATKVLKDGDLVEVDAEKGIVKIIEKNNPF